MGRIVRGLRGALVLILVCAASAQAAEGAPSAVVSAFQKDLLGVMKEARRLGVRGRYERLRPIIERTFHLPVMISTVSRPFWRNGTTDQRKRLLAAFRRMSVSTLATLFDDYNGETFRVVGTRRASPRTVLVDTEIVRPGKEPVEISYVVAKLRARWWIVDIIVGGGISELTVRRSEYQKLLKEGGLDNLVAALDAKADRLLAGTGAGAAAEASR